MPRRIWESPSAKIENGQTELAFVALLHRAAELMRNQLMAVADPEHGQASGEDGGSALKDWNRS